MQLKIISHISPKLYHIILPKSLKQRIQEWFYKSEIPWNITENPNYNISYLCNKGFAAHLVKYHQGQYIVDLNCLSKYSKYGCLLTLSQLSNH